MSIVISKDGAGGDTIEDITTTISVSLPDGEGSCLSLWYYLSNPVVALIITFHYIGDLCCPTLCLDSKAIVVRVVRVL